LGYWDRLQAALTLVSPEKNFDGVISSLKKSFRDHCVANYYFSCACAKPGDEAAYFEFRRASFVAKSASG
jgi:hypothetical protein